MNCSKNGKSKSNWFVVAYVRYPEYCPLWCPFQNAD